VTALPPAPVSTCDTASMMRRMLPWVWKTFHNPEVGTITVHRAWWQPGRIRQVWFQSEGSTVMHEVPRTAVDRLLEAETLEQAMAVIRAAG